MSAAAVEQPARAFSVPVRFQKVDDPHSNDAIQKMKVMICSPGKNRNYLYLSKESLERAKPSLAYTPVVGRVYEKVDEKGEVVGHYFGGHEYEADENLVLRPTTVPYGVMANEEPWWETVLENGVDVEYLCGYCYLWTGRWPVLKEAAWDDEFWFSQSMEASFGQWRIYEEDSNFVELLDLRFDAICILGYDPEHKEYHTEPAFPSAGFVPAFSLDGAMNGFRLALLEMKNQLSAFFASNSSGTSNQKGGIGLDQETKNAIFAKFGLSEDHVDFQVTEEMTEEELARRLEEFAAQSSEGQAPEPENPDGDPVSLFSLTFREKECGLRELISSFERKEEDEAGNLLAERYAYLLDFDAQYVYYKIGEWKRGGAYQENVFRSSYQEAENGLALSGEPVPVSVRYLTQDEIQRLEAERAQAETDRAQLQELLQFKADAEKRENREKAEEMLSRFQDVSEMEGFEAIKEDAEHGTAHDLAQLELRLFALRGKKASAKPARSDTEPLRMGIEGAPDSGDDGYGGLLNRVRSRNKS